MPGGHLLDSVLLTDELSPVPGAPGFAGAIMSFESDEPVSLTTVLRMHPTTYGTSTFQPGPSWATTTGRVRQAFEREWERVLDYVSPLAATVSLSTTFPPRHQPASIAVSARVDAR